MKRSAQTFSSAFDALADTPQEAANTCARTELAQALTVLSQAQDADTRRGHPQRLPQQSAHAPSPRP